MHKALCRVLRVLRVYISASACAMTFEIMFICENMCIYENMCKYTCIRP
jgi:hypothetical protein